MSQSKIDHSQYSIESFDEVIQNCQRSQYHTVADVLEHFADHDVNQFGPSYDVFDTPCDDSEMEKRLLWAFKAGRSFQADIQRESE